MSEQATADRLEYTATLGIIAMEGRGFEYPTDMVAASNGRLYVANRSRDFGERGVRITVLDLDSEYYGTFGHFGSADGQLISPMCIAEDANGRIHVSDDYTHRITSFTLDGEFVRAWGTHGNDPGQLNGPSGIAFDAAGNLYVSDTHNHRIQKFAPDGEFILTFGEEGSAPGQLTLPWGVHIAPNGDIYVADWGNDRIQRFAPHGEFIATYGSPGRSPGQLLRPSGVAVDALGYIYISDWGNERVQILDPQGNFHQSLRGQAGLSKWAANFLQINREEGNARATADLSTTPGIPHPDDPHAQSAHIEKLFWSPMSVKLDRQGRLYVTEGNRHRIQVYRRPPHAATGPGGNTAPTREDDDVRR